MVSFLEASRASLARMGRNVAETMIQGRVFFRHTAVTGRAKAYVQPLRLIPGMPAAPEPCALPRHWSVETHPKNAGAQLKVDGIHALYVDTSIVSREALPLDCALHCLAPLHDLEQLYGEKMVFDGEYEEPEGFQATIAAMRRGTGVGTIWLFDAVPYDEWARNRFTQPLEERVRKLCQMQAQLHSPFVQSLGLSPAPTAEEAMQLAEHEWSRGGEGIVVKDMRSTYVRGKTMLWQKIKKKQTFDGPITDLLIKAGRCQAILVMLPDDSPTPGKIARVGSNIPEELREAMGREPDSFQGAMVEVCFTDTTDTGALKGGYFVRLRPDKENTDVA